MARKVLMNQTFRFVDKEGNVVKRFKTINDVSAFRIANRDGFKGEIQRVYKLSNGEERYDTVGDTSR